MHPALETVKHRPWPLPDGQWKWRQSWLDLAFIHLRVATEKIRALLPAGVRLQEFDGTAWVGLVPFRMAGVMRRPLPDIPHFSSFPELNLRTYVEVGKKSGVWFFSLDADSWPVVFGGRHIYGLPYFPATMQLERDDSWFSFRSVRRAGSVRFVARYRPVDEVFFAEPGTFEHWATERYCLYSFSDRRGIARVEVHHAPWPLQRAEVAIEECSVLSSAGISPIEGGPICHFSTGVDVVSFATEKANQAPEPTTMAVTICAGAQLAPAIVVAHL
jgi:uncharacterized protein